MKPFLQKREGIWYLWENKRESFYDKPDAWGVSVKEAWNNFLEYYNWMNLNEHTTNN